MDAYQKSMLELVKTALYEDVGKGDLTSLACLEPGPVAATIVAKSAGVLSGVEPAFLTFDIVDSANNVEFLKSDGDRFEPGTVIASIDGFNLSVLASERVALNFLGHLSGVATLAGELVDCIQGVGTTSTRLLDTRKTIPGLRHLEKRAVLHGGGMNHRIGLYDMILIKDNHIASAGSIKDAVARTREYLTTADFRLQFLADADEIKIEVEVENEKMLREAIEAGVDRLLLDNQSPESLKQLVAVAREIDANVELEASGNITKDNIADIAASGVDFISVGAITHSAPCSDFSLRIKE